MIGTATLFLAWAVTSSETCAGPLAALGAQITAEMESAMALLEPSVVVVRRRPVAVRRPPVRRRVIVR